jgi:hypothetical protein
MCCHVIDMLLSTRGADLRESQCVPEKLARANLAQMLRRNSPDGLT